MEKAIVEGRQVITKRVGCADTRREKVGAVREGQGACVCSHCQVSYASSHGLQERARAA
jgi:hypothetical protein